MNALEIDQKISEIDERIGKIDNEISTLERKRKELKAWREKLQDKKFYQKSTELAQQNWDLENFPWSNNIRGKLSSIFGFEFRSKQLEVCNVILSKLDCLMVSPTGGGKSLW